ncbi:MAG TPA: hypothetical protein VFT06_00680, partial [Flavisolibacter sp.]|nr:hypothetical protein [Flavisolibacter sp.]
RKIELDIRPEDRPVTNADLHHGQNHAVEVEKNFIIGFDVVAMITKERRLHPLTLSAFSINSSRILSTVSVSSAQASFSFRRGSFASVLSVENCLPSTLYGSPASIFSFSGFIKGR